MPVQRCENCGEVVSPASGFCQACGQPVATRGAPGSARRAHRLLIRTIDGHDRDVPLDRPVFTVGRGQDNDIILPEPYVSIHHGRLAFQAGVWTYRDLNSTNGTTLNARRTEGGPLQDGDVLRIGDPSGNSVSLTFAAPEGHPTERRRLMGTTHTGSMAVGRRPVLTIGRVPEADIVLEAPLVSREHARLERTSEGVILTDLKSTNGTFVNGERLTHPHLLAEDDLVQIGPFRLVYTGTTLERYAPTAGVRLDALRLVHEVGPPGRRKRILDDVSLSIAPREFVAVVGTSGAGKTTLLLALNGFTRAAGHVLINGDDLYQHFDLYRTLVGYVPQDDIIHKNLTVVNGLRYAARLRLPPDTPSEEIERRISEVLEQVEMVGQREQLVTSLSGGQRKRVSIALELLAEPKLFFLDEPTSGLDPGLEKKMMVTLRRLADGGRTVILVTHATANIVQCDHVCFLARGRLVYFGPPQKVLEFFGVTTGDYADVYGLLDDLDPEVAQEKAVKWEQRFRQSQYCRDYVIGRLRRVRQVQVQAASAPARQRPRVDAVRQFLVLTRRYLDLVLRDRVLLLVLVAVMPMIGAFLALVSESNWLTGNTLAEIERQLAEGATGGQSATYGVAFYSQLLLFILALTSVLLGLFASGYEIVKERSVYQRERMVSLRILPYLASKLAVLGAFAFIQCLLLLLVTSLRVSFPKEGVLLSAPLEIYITLVLSTVAAVMMGLFISAAVPNEDAVIYILLVALFFQMLFAGVVFDLPGITRQFSALTLSRWSLEALGCSSNVEGLNQLGRIRFLPDPITETVSMEVIRPDADWKPVTVTTVTEEIEVPVGPGLTKSVVISAPQVTVNEMVTVSEIVTDTLTVQPVPVDRLREEEFWISYSRTPAHLLVSWGLIALLGMGFGGAAVAVLRSKDVG